MTSKTCGARSVDLGEITSCGLEEGHAGLHSDGAIGWVADECPIELSGERYTTPHGARALIASLQRQLDALDPDAAVAEAERRMLGARERRNGIRAIASDSDYECIALELKRADEALFDTIDAWRDAIEARDAKGGGA